MPVSNQPATFMYFMYRIYSYNRPLELILKDISTVRHNPACLWRWSEIAMEEIMR